MGRNVSGSPERRNAALRGFSAARQSGSALGALIGIVLLIAAVVFLVWRFAPEHLPGVLRMELPPSPLDLTHADAGPGAGGARGATAASARPANPPLYKWKDANGVLNVTDVPPVGRDYETVVVNPETNVLPSEQAPETPEQ